MKLKTLIKDLDLLIKGPKEISISGISSDSRTVSPGNLFIAKRGAAFDGTQFIAQAINAGAAAIVTDIYDPFLDITQIIHPKVAAIEAKLASRYYGHPCSELFTLGVTGTKGKTTTTYIIKHLLDGLNKACGLVGTVETVVGPNRFFSTLTTHDVISNQKLLREMINKGCKAVALEVSSHGLDQGRVDEIEFDTAVFTNLYPDHLDYHKTFDEYAAAKKKLFAKSDHILLNADSYWADYKGVTFGIDKGDIRATKIAFTPFGTEFTIDNCVFQSPLIGRFNIYNALGAVAAVLTTGSRLEQIAPILATFPGVPARLERVGNVFIDFAHTGEALDNVLQTLKEISPGRIIVVFGCGGNRDPQRRIGMAQAAEKWADISIITNDNPRHEDPNEIARQIATAFCTTPIIELDRRRAINLAIGLATPNDFVLIAGKGHERVQIFGNQTVSFDDAAIVKEALQNQKNSAIVVPS